MYETVVMYGLVQPCTDWYSHVRTGASHVRTGTVMYGLVQVMYGLVQVMYGLVGRPTTSCRPAGLTSLLVIDLTDRNFHVRGDVIAQTDKGIHLISEIALLLYQATELLLL